MNKKTKKRNRLKQADFKVMPKILNLSVTNNQTMCYFTLRVREVESTLVDQNFSGN